MYYKQYVGISDTTLGGTTTSTTSTLEQYTAPELIDVHEKSESVELIFRQYLQYNLWGGVQPKQETKIFKIIYSVVDGKWHRSDPIPGKVVPAQKESYEF